MPMTTPSVPAVPSSSTPMSVRRRELGDEHEEQHDVERLLGALEHARPAAGRACCPLPRARSPGCGSCATNAVSAQREPDRQPMNSTTTATEDRPVGSAHDARVACPQLRAAGNAPAARVPTLHRRGLALARRGRSSAGAARRARRAARARRRRCTRAPAPGAPRPSGTRRRRRARSADLPARSAIPGRARRRRDGGRSARGRRRSGTRARRWGRRRRGSGR